MSYTRFRTSYVVFAIIALCVAAGPLQAVTITVGTIGDHQTIQDAINEALSDGGSDTIRIEGPRTYQENLTAYLVSGEELALSGGWNAGFTARTDDPALTVIDGGLARVVEATASNGALLDFSNLTVQNGGGVQLGGGMKIVASGSSTEIHVNNVIFSGNEVEAGAAEGGGLYLSLDSAYAEVNGNRFVDNIARVPSPQPAANSAFGGGISINLKGSAELEFTRNLVQGNACTAAEPAGDARGCGVYLSYRDTATFTFSENRVLNNSVTGFEYVNGIGGNFRCVIGAPNQIERNRWQGTTVTDSAASGPSVLRIVLEYCELTQRSSLIADGESSGLIVHGHHTSIWQGVNLTVSGNDSHGIIVIDSHGVAEHKLYNSISFGNTGNDLQLVASATVEQGNNHIGSDPGCVNPTGGYYQLRTGSTALDAGTGSPPGGLSTLDLDGNDRVEPPEVDIGAYEGTGMVSTLR